MFAASTYVSTGPVEVPKALQEGEKFIKWDDDSGTGTPVTMRIDSKGFYLYWIDQNNEMDILDIATIRDTRTGPFAKKPKDSKLRQIVTLGSQDTLEEKTVTICHGCDFVNVTFVNFCCTKREIAQVLVFMQQVVIKDHTQSNGRYRRNYVCAKCVLPNDEHQVSRTGALISHTLQFSPVLHEEAYVNHHGYHSISNNGAGSKH